MRRSLRARAECGMRNAECATPRRFQTYSAIRNPQSAFTMIELLIVISIIAILAASIIPNFIGFDSEARVAASKSNLDTLRSRVTLFRAKEGRYPATLDELVSRTYMDAGARKPYLP